MNPQDIPVSEPAHHHLLGCRLEQSLIGDDCGKFGDTTGEAQHGRASGQMGIYSGILAVLRWAATQPAQTPETIQIEMKDVELAEIITNVSLRLKKEIRWKVAAQKVCTRRML